MEKPTKKYETLIRTAYQQLLYIHRQQRRLLKKLLKFLKQKIWI